MDTLNIDRHTVTNKPVTYLPRHGATRNVIGRRPLPWQSIAGEDVAIGLDINHAERRAVLILTSDHDEVHITLTYQQVDRLADRLTEATFVVAEPTGQVAS
jgi:hypothetical protein